MEHDANVIAAYSKRERAAGYAYAQRRIYDQRRFERPDRDRRIARDWAAHVLRTARVILRVRI